MKKKSEKLLGNFKNLLWTIAFLGIVMALNAVFFHSEILNQMCGAGIVFTIVILIMTMVKTNSVWRMEENEDIQKTNEYLQTKYKGKVWCYEGKLSEEEIWENPFFRGHIVYPKMQIEGEFQGKKFKFRHIWAEEYHRNAEDHTNNTRYVLFKGSQLQWIDKRFIGNNQLLLFTSGFSKRTGFKPKKAGYILLRKLQDGSEIFGLNETDFKAEEFLISLYEKVHKEVKNREKEICVLLKRDLVEIFVEEIGLNNSNIQDKMRYIENMIQ